MSEAEESPRDTLPRLKLAPQQSGFATHIGPFYEIELAHGMRRAVLLDQRHLNPEGVVHGGLIASFAEYVLYRAIGDEIGHSARFATIDLHTQFLAAAFPNRWRYGAAHVLRRTRTLIFTAREIFDQQRRVAFVSGISKLIEAESEG